VLYPSWLATNSRRDWGAAIQDGQPVELAYPAAQSAPIHPDDVAEVAVDLLLHDIHRGRLQILTGPESMRLDEAVWVVGATLGRTIPVAEISRRPRLARRSRPGRTRSGPLRYGWSIPMSPPVPDIEGSPWKSSSSRTPQLRANSSPPPSPT
jgi:hypothetical protein